MGAVDAVKLEVSEIWNSYIRVPWPSAVAFFTVSVGRSVSSCSWSAGASRPGAVTFTTVGVVGAAGLSEPHPPTATISTMRVMHEMFNRIINVLSSSEIHNHAETFFDEPRGRRDDRGTGGRWARRDSITMMLRCRSCTAFERRAPRNRSAIALNTA